MARQLGLTTLAFRLALCLPRVTPHRRSDETLVMLLVLLDRGGRVGGSGAGGVTSSAGNREEDWPGLSQERSAEGVVAAEALQHAAVALLRALSETDLVALLRKPPGAAALAFAVGGGGWGLSNVTGPQVPAAAPCLLLGVWDTARLLVSSAVPPLRLRRERQRVVDIERLATAFALAFGRWVSGNGAREACRTARGWMWQNTAAVEVEAARAAEAAAQAQRAQDAERAHTALKVMPVFSLRHRGTRESRRGDWFIVVAEAAQGGKQDDQNAQPPRPKMFEMTTDDRAVLRVEVAMATASGWRPPAAHLVGDQPQKQLLERKRLPRRPPATPATPNDGGAAFATVDAIRRCIYASVLGVATQPNPDGEDLDRLPLLLRNLEAAPACRCAPPKRLASSTGHPDGATWLFEVGDHFYVLVMDGWSGERAPSEEARSAWPGGAVLFECAFYHWAHGVLLAVLSQAFTRHAANYHMRFSLGSSHCK